MPNPLYVYILDLYDLSKYCNVSPKIQLNISYLFIATEKANRSISINSV